MRRVNYSSEKCFFFQFSCRSLWNRITIIAFGSSSRTPPPPKKTVHESKKGYLVFHVTMKHKYANMLYMVLIYRYSELLGLCLSSGILESRPVSVLIWGGETPILLGPLERANLDHWTAYVWQGNGPIRHVETCHDFFFHCKSTHNKIHCQNCSC
jgi:hypothetical protein